jgi:hypothetical protein
MKAYPHVISDEAPKYKCELPYNQFELGKLEESLTNWISSLGVTRADTFVHILPDIKSGVVL